MSSRFISPLHIKIVFAPLVLTVAMVGLAVMGGSYLKTNMEAFRQLVSGPIAVSDDLDVRRRKIESVHLNINRLAALSGVETDQAKIERLANDILKQIGDLKSVADKDHPISSSSISDSPSAKLEKLVGPYVSSASAVADMLKSDVGTALMLLRKADRLFSSVVSEIEEQQKVADAARDSSISGIVASQTDQLHTQFWVSLISALAGLAASALVGRSILRSISEIAQVLQQLASGRLDVDIPGRNSRDEFGRISGAAESFKANLKRKQELERKAEEEEHRAAEDRCKAGEEAIGRERTMVSYAIGNGMAKLAGKDLTFRLREDLPQAYCKLQADFNAAVDELERAVDSVRTGSDGIKSGTREIAQASEDLSRRTENQAASLVETTAAVSEMASTVAKTAEGAGKARQVVATAKTEAEKSGDVVRKAVDAMGDIEKSSKEITQIIGVINEIAFQTNLLALNAGVEAARAGEAGRGFAVVASEVRALAQRSAEAAKQIKDLISTSSSQVDQGVKLVGESGAALDRIVASVSQINAVVAEIAAGAERQAIGLHEISSSVTKIDQITQQNAAMAEEATAAAHCLAQRSDELARLVDHFQTSKSTTSGLLRDELKKAVPHVFVTQDNAPVSAGAATRPTAMPETRPQLKPKVIAANTRVQPRAAISAQGRDSRKS
jgi:methyl-accepting chemotaxis protein